MGKAEFYDKAQWGFISSFSLMLARNVEDRWILAMSTFATFEMSVFEVKIFLSMYSTHDNNTNLNHNFNEISLRFNGKDLKKSPIFMQVKLW